MKLKTALFAAIATFAVAAAQAKIVENTDYIVRSNVIKPLQADKIEVTEFFGYFCIHCQHLEPALERQSRRFASDTVLRQEHIVWQPAHQPLARLSAAVKATGLSRQANRSIFKVLMDGQVEDETQLKAWIEQQPYGSKLLAAYNDPKSAAAAQTMQQMTTQYNITKTPTIVVGGKYELVDSKNMQALQELIEKVRAERHMPAPTPRAAVRSRASSFAGQANR